MTSLKNPDQKRLQYRICKCLDATFVKYCFRNWQCRGIVFVTTQTSLTYGIES